MAEVLVNVGAMEGREKSIREFFQPNELIPEFCPIRDKEGMVRADCSVNKVQYSRLRV